jgi:hypothetical protein
MKKALTFAVLAAFAAFQFGCAELRMGTNTGEDDMMVSDSLVISDMPVPQGYKVDSKSSFFSVNPTTKIRVAFVTYRGRGDAVRLMEFFRQNMVISGWDLKSESGDFGAYVLKFDKGAEAAEIKIIPGRFTTKFTMSVNPRAGR